MLLAMMIGGGITAYAGMGNALAAIAGYSSTKLGDLASAVVVMDIQYIFEKEKKYAIAETL